MKFQSFGLTDKGKVRDGNEDQFLVAEIHRVLEVTRSSLPTGALRNVDVGPAGHLLMVADGVGGSSAGEEASSLALQAMVAYVAECMTLSKPGISLEDDLLDEFTKAIASSHRRVLSEAEENPSLEGMATTLTMGYVLGLRAFIGHVGDSRAYLVRGGKPIRLTRDQTLAELLLDRGVVTEGSTGEGRLKNVLVSVVGGGSSGDPEIKATQLTLDWNDAIVLCTDGLTKHVSDERIASLVSESSSAEDGARRLLNEALDRGGSDNVSVIVGRFVPAS